MVASCSSGLLRHHHLHELLVVDLPVAVHVRLADHLVDLLVRQLLACGPRAFSDRWLAGAKCWPKPLKACNTADSCLELATTPSISFAPSKVQRSNPLRSHQPKALAPRLVITWRSSAALMKPLPSRSNTYRQCEPQTTNTPCQPGLIQNAPNTINANFDTSMRFPSLF